MKRTQKICERCRMGFECRVEDIMTCHCHEVILEEELRDLITSRFHDCLCAVCLLELREEGI